MSPGSHSFCPDFSASSQKSGLANLQGNCVSTFGLFLHPPTVCLLVTRTTSLLNSASSPPSFAISESHNPPASICKHACLSGVVAPNHGSLGTSPFLFAFPLIDRALLPALAGVFQGFLASEPAIRHVRSTKLDLEPLPPREQSLIQTRRPFQPSLSLLVQILPPPQHCSWCKRRHFQDPKIHLPPEPYQYVLSITSSLKTP